MTRFVPRVFAWVGGALFVGSLVFCAATYVVTWSTPARLDVNWRAVAIDTLLFSVFALHHSLFARDEIKRALTRLVPGHLLQSTYVWIAASLFFAVCALWRPIGGEVFQVTGARLVAHAVVQLLGLLLIARAVAGIDALELAGIRQVGNRVRLPPSRAERASASLAEAFGGGGKPDATKANVLQTGGVYRLVRHSLYLGWMLLVFGAAHMTGDRLAFAAVSVLYLVIAIPWEERSLRAAFGDEYVRYQGRVRWRMIPFIY